MGKICSFKQLKTTKKYRNSYLEAAGIEKYQDILEIITYVLDLLYTESERFLRDNDFPIREFIIDDDSAKAFLAADYMEAYIGGEEELSISYIANIGGVLYKTLATARIDGDNVETDVNIYKKSDNEWFAYDGNGNWVEGPGKDFL